MKKITSWVFLLALASAAPVLAQITFTANPSALPAGVNSVTLTWNAPGHAQVDIHVLSATGPQPFGTQVSSGSAPVTASWVVPGLTFYLVDHNTSVVLATLTLTSLGEWDILAADQSACLPFPVLNQGGGYVTCWRVGYFHWYAIGGGWSTGFTLTNPTSSDIAVQITVEGTSGNPYTPPSVVLNGLPLTLGANATAAGTLPAHGVLRFVFPNNGAPGITNGQIYVQVSAKDGVSLNTIQAVEDYTYTNPQNVVYSTVTLPIAWVDQAINSYSSMFEESSSDQSYGAFAVKEMSGSPQVLDVKLFDVNGNQLGDKTVNLAANQTWANTSDAEFGASAFTGLPSVPIVRLQFTGAAPIAVLVLQGRGQTVSSIPAQPVYEQ